MTGKSARALWTEKLAGRGGETLPMADGSREKDFGRRKFCGVVIGIDASLRGTGIAIVDFSATAPKLSFSKRIICHRDLSFYQCIGKIFEEISAALRDFAVDAAAVEQTIYVQNHKISHILGAAKGAAIAAAVNGRLEVFEYAPLSIKQAITGAGRASKEQIRRTVCKLFAIENISYDESDAIGAACCHAWRWRRNF
jgi:crossover junction endodeoxyribonuclease RuvC